MQATARRAWYDTSQISQNRASRLPGLLERRSERGSDRSAHLSTHTSPAPFHLCCPPDTLADLVSHSLVLSPVSSAVCLSAWALLPSARPTCPLAHAPHTHIPLNHCSYLCNPLSFVSSIVPSQGQGEEIYTSLTLEISCHAK